MYLYQLPRWVAPLLLVVFLVAGLALRGPAGAAALCVVAAVLGLAGRAVLAALVGRRAAWPDRRRRHHARDRWIPGHPLAQAAS